MIESLYGEQDCLELGHPKLDAQRHTPKNILKKRTAVTYSRQKSITLWYDCYLAGCAEEEKQQERVDTFHLLQGEIVYERADITHRM